MCVPFSIVILPTPPDSQQFGNYSLAIEAEQAVLEAVVASVENATLQLETINSFDSSFPIKLVVSGCSVAGWSQCVTCCC